ncbi:hypothetical protein WMY93_022655 [Mugilogobius chulae]|uniref:Uncharacterized protein n=1 Tax=Mugilogobius chulae TaxID=88201 RepID=A0AAW0N8Q6_9GOBI
MMDEILRQRSIVTSLSSVINSIGDDEEVEDREDDGEDNGTDSSHDCKMSIQEILAKGVDDDVPTVIKIYIVAEEKRDIAMRWNFDSSPPQPLLVKTNKKIQKTLEISGSSDEAEGYFEILTCEGEVFQCRADTWKEPDESDLVITTVIREERILSFKKKPKSAVRAFITGTSSGYLDERGSTRTSLCANLKDILSM